jgi:hypothetical protein
MKTDAQHKIFDEITRLKVFVIGDKYVPAIRTRYNKYTSEDEVYNGEEDYVLFSECYIEGYPFTNPYFPYLSKLGNEFLQEVDANSYDKSIDYIRYLKDLKTKFEKLLLDSFEDFHGLTRYRYFSEIVHVDFMNVDHHLQIEDIERDSDIHIRVHEFSTRLQEILHGIQEKLNTIYSKFNISEFSDKRINCSASKETIQRYFYHLDRVNSNGDQILTSEQIAQLLQANFYGFGESIEKTKLTPVGLTVADIRYFIYNFIKHYDIKGNKKTYAQFCIDNFKQFNNVDITTITSNFSKKPKKYFLN